MSPATWFAAHRDDLVERPSDRAQNLAVAVALLPLFEARPEHWAALPWLNAAEPRRRQSFGEYLAEWRRQAPAARAMTIEAIAAVFGEPLPEAVPTEPGR